MRPRGQTPRMQENPTDEQITELRASMRPRGQTPRMHPQIDAETDDTGYVLQ